MPGIFGFTGGMHLINPEQVLNRMSESLRLESWYRQDLHHSPDISFGRVSLGITNDSAQPVWNDSHSICLIMEGEVFDYQAMKMELIKRGYQFKDGHEAEFLLHLYEEYGEEFVTGLNGAFSLAIWDNRHKKLLLANDRLALQRIYYAQHEDHLIFASKIAGILGHPQTSRTIDPLAIAQFITFDHALGNRTILKKVKMLPPASILVFQSGEARIKIYWEPQFTEPDFQLTEQDYSDGLIFHLRQAAVRRAPGDLSAGIMLSGGLDSRLILGLLNEQSHNGSLHTFTFGNPGCDDARYAREATKKVGATHHFFPLRPTYLRNVVTKGLHLVNDLANCLHLHALATLSAEARYARIFYKGFLGDALLGYGLTRKMWANYNPGSPAEFQYQNHLDQGLLTFPLEEHRHLFTPDMQGHLDGSLLDSYERVMLAAKSGLAAHQRLYFDLTQRVPRMTINGVDLVRSQAVVRLPFTDNDLIDYVLRLPAGYMLDRYLAKQVLVRAYPELAKVPYTETGYPLVPCARDLLLRLDRQSRWYLRNLGLTFVPAPQRTTYASYNQWMRNELRPWVESILLAPRSLQRGLFNPEYVRKLIDEHMNGDDHALRLGALISLELWQQNYLD